MGELGATSCLKGRILLIEPRRLAARAAAARLAQSIGEPLGHRVGYSVRNEQKRSAYTHVEAITDGLFLRRLQSQPDLPGVDCVIFDEFHERRRDSDVALALLRESRRILRPDLKVLLMSATLQIQELASQLDDAESLTSEGRAYPVELRHCPKRERETQEQHVLRAVEEELLGLEKQRSANSSPPGVLVFLPGIREIERCRQRLLTAPSLKNWDIRPLHGQMPLKQQNEVLSPCDGCWSGRIVLATSIAESSLTLDGIRLVIDTGLSRHTRFDPGTGMEGLVTVPASLASAEQRCGRAGRQAPGRCVRLWSAAEHQRRPLQDRPELQRADPQPTVLDLAQWGAGLGEDLPWLEAPPRALLEEGQQQLKQLGLLNSAGQITTDGRRVAGFGMHPRLGRMLLQAKRWGVEPLACDLAALLSERDASEFRNIGADLSQRLRSLRTPHRADGLSTIRQQSRQWQRQLKQVDLETEGTLLDEPTDLAMARLIATAFPEWLAMARPGRVGAFVLQQGRGAMLPESDPLSTCAALAVAQLDLKDRDARIRIAVPLGRSTLQAMAEEAGEWKDQVIWDEKQQKIRAERVLNLGALELQRQQLPRPSADLVSEVLLTRLRESGLDLLPWDDRCEQLRRRLQLAHRRLGSPWPNRSRQRLQEVPEDWILEASLSCSSWTELESPILQEALWGSLSWPERRELDRLLPERLTIPSGRNAPLHYSEEEVILAVKLQEMFGCAEGPVLLDGDLPVTLELLSPAGRPLQRTRDLRGFWDGSYNDVRREMRGRYPKHPWPESPMTAVPTAETKKAL